MADIPVNDVQWNAVSAEQQNDIITTLREAGALREEDTIVPSTDVEPFTEDTVLEPLWNPLRDICRAACDATATTAFAACSAKFGASGVGLVACLAGAKAIQKACRDRC